jgi:hypothetical protein
LKIDHPFGPLRWKLRPTPGSCGKREDGLRSITIVTRTSLVAEVDSAPRTADSERRGTTRKHSSLGTTGKTNTPISRGLSRLWKLRTEAASDRQTVSPGTVKKNNEDLPSRPETSTR